MNGILLVAEIIMMFTALLLFKKLFGKDGLFIWIALATVIANIQVLKSVDIVGIGGTVGNVMFASVFLATNLLRECYSKEDAKKGVYIGVISVLPYLLATELTLLYAPSDIDMTHNAMTALFSLSPRVCAASLIMYAIANFADVHIYDKLHKLFNGEKLWLRSSISAMLCNCFENFGFVFLAFAGVYPTYEVLLIAVSTSVIEIGITLFNTPFIYLGKRF